MSEVVAYYPPETRAMPLTLIRRERLLPVPGKVLVNTGDKVLPTSIVAQAEMIGFVGVRVVAGKAQHYITFKSPSDLAIWRSRVDELHEKEIILAKSNPWGSFAAAFGTTAPGEAAKAKGGKK